MPNIWTKLQLSRLRAFTVLESLLVLFVTSFLLLMVTQSIQGVVQQTQEKLFFVSFEQLYKDSQQLAISTNQLRSLTVSVDEISNGVQTLALPRTVKVKEPMTIHFDKSGGNSSLASITFYTEKERIRYQLYLGSGRYKIYKN